MQNNGRILAWIETLPEYSKDLLTTPVTSPKRKALQELSPPATENDMETPTAKRRKLDADRTPRAVKSNALNISATSSASGSYASSVCSGATSPIKRQIMGLSLDEGGFDRRLLTIDKPPVLEAAHIFSSLAEIGDGEGILPMDRRDEVLKSPEVEEAGPRRWRHSFKDSADFENLPGRIPSLQEVATILKRATDCHMLGHEEAGWNEEVHGYLLAAVFRGPNDSEVGLSTARPHKALLPKSIGVKMIDYCIFAHPSRGDASMENWLKALSRETMTLSVNHIVDVPRLQLRPIVTSIETKEPSQSFNVAEVQMGVWHATQWAFLRCTMLSLLRSASDAATDDECEQHAEKALSELAFIPGIIVHGHRWFFVLSTRGDDGKMLFWTEYEFGSTLSTRGIYQIVAGLRLLGSWAETTFMPWFHRNLVVQAKP
ncbi:hypothetical protein FALBO_2400 [Fusarium albosuccineum]|uniref:PD-(D/E)XK nuclease-like domain-containing protein n=1 Tax=Fusarium albosuccineum TaxID=1237068 RepID=A0A8H4PHV3_9HYPO|nr:hypothetical protein FALBO_2400 [Fusarium albosuccineum]